MIRSGIMLDRWSMIWSESRYPLFGIMLDRWSMISSENRYPLFGTMLDRWSMISSENRCPLFGIMLYCCDVLPTASSSDFWSTETPTSFSTFVMYCA